MIVVSDTSPLNYLVRIGAIDVLAVMYGTILIPEMVATELSHPASPPEVRSWLQQGPPWLQVVQGGQNFVASELAALDPGEREAIGLAVRLGANPVIIDEVLGRHAAERLGLRVIGTVGVLRDAAHIGLLDLPQAIARLRETRFHISERILEDVLKDYIER